MKTSRRNFLKLLAPMSFAITGIACAKAKFKKHDIVKVVSDCDPLVAGQLGEIHIDEPIPELPNFPYKVRLQNGEDRWAQDRDLILIRRYA